MVGHFKIVHSLKIKHVPEYRKKSDTGNYYIKMRCMQAKSTSCPLCSKQFQKLEKVKCNCRIVH